MSSDYVDAYELNEEDISNFSENELVSRAVDIFSADETTQIVFAGLFMSRAKELGCEENIKRVIAKLDKQNKALQKQYDDEERASKALSVKHPARIERDRNGKALPTIENIKAIMLNDPQYDGIMFNIVRNAAEVHDGKSVRRWSDADAATSMMYIESEYNIYSAEKHTAALRLLFREREYNPIADIVTSIKWDGIERCENFLTKWAKADDTPYVREVSRLIFAGGIWRLMLPGCKFDDVPILIGDQGNGKSSLCRFLAINDDYFGEIKDFDGQNSIEQMQGKWICEVAELAALTKKKEIETAKAFITRQRDQYRKPYDREPTELPRRCVLIGTCNLRNPLSDMSGNRRFYPVTVASDGYEVFKAEEEIRDYAKQCWAEAYAKYLKGEMPNFAREDLRSEYRAAQENAMQDDWRIGAIQEYLDSLPNGYLVCARELMHKALSPEPEHPKDPTMKDSKEIGEIMNRFKEWEKMKFPTKTDRYGTQRCWKKVSGNSVADELPF